MNLLDAACVRRGIASVREGRVCSLALPLRAGQGPLAEGRPHMAHYMLRDGGDYAAGLGERGGFGFADDVISLATHGTTHLDALAHVWRDGRMYNGFPSSEVTSRGAHRCGIDKAGPIVTRAILVDAVPPGRRWLEPGEALRAEQLDAAVHVLGVTPEPGDALLVRTGWVEWWRAAGPDPAVDRWPGLHPDCAEWVAAHDLVLVGADNIAVEVGPSPVEGQAAPMHISLLRDRGVYLMELLDFTGVGDRLPGTGLLVVNPLAIERATASPVAPVLVL